MPLPGLVAAAVLCADADWPDVVPVLEGLGFRADAGSAALTCDDGRIEVVAVPVVAGGPPVAEVVAVRAIADAATDAAGQRRVRGVLDRCRLVLRCRLHPGLRVGDERVGIVLAVAEACGGLVFDSRVVRGESGVAVLR